MIDEMIYHQYKVSKINLRSEIAMKKFFFVSILIVFGFCSFSEKWRYGILQESADGQTGTIAIVDSPEKFDDSKVDGNKILSLNTSVERYIAMSGYNNIKSFYYEGALSLVYMDLTDPYGSLRYINSWSEFTDYVNGVE